MKETMALTALCLLVAAPLVAQQVDTIRTDTKQPVHMQTPVTPKVPVESKVYYGGNLGASFGEYFRIAVTPLVGYKLDPRASAGVKVSYEYTEDTRFSQAVTSNNFGGSIFARYSIHPQVYAHAEYAAMSYKYATGNFTSDREWVPFILLGGGAVQPISSRTAIFVEVLFDVLQSSQSPYEKWTPMISAGVGVGF